VETKEIVIKIPAKLYGNVTIEVVNGDAKFLEITPKLKLTGNNINISESLKEIIQA
jgi:hypothetical protein